MFQRILVLFLTLNYVNGFVHPISAGARYQDVRMNLADGDWIGEVVANNAGKIKGCAIQKVEGSLTEWTIQIDGVEANLGKFSEVVYKKLCMDAKQQRFQGFRPNTVPPHLLPTYKAYAMDEVCRETTLEAMQQNGIRPFDGAREEFEFMEFSIPPPASKKKKGGKKKKDVDVEEEPVEEPSWKSFDSMKEAIDGGWQPGQSFSFVTKSVKGQKLAVGEQARQINPLNS